MERDENIFIIFVTWMLILEDTNRQIRIARWTMCVKFNSLFELAKQFIRNVRIFMIANISKNLSKRFLRFGAAQMKISDVDERPKSYLNVDVDKMFSISI